MNELISTIDSEHGDILVSGRELHEFLEVGTRYDTWFSRMVDYGFTENVDFIEVVQKVDAQKRARTYDQVDHHIKLDAAKEIAMIQRTERGKQARQYFLQIEKAWNSPEQIMARALKMADRKINSLQNQIELDQPYTSFGKAVSNSIGAIPIGEFCKILYQNDGIKIGRNKLFEWLRTKGYLIRDGREKNNPKQKYIESGLFVVVPKLIKTDKKDIQSATTLITGKGQVKIADELKLISA
jgi:anti-repressor protein